MSLFDKLGIIQPSKGVDAAEAAAEAASGGCWPYLCDL